MGAAKQFGGVVLFAACCAVVAQAADDGFAERLRAGTEEVRQNNFSAAMADLASAVRLDSESAEAWYQLGLLYGQIADFKNAEDAFRRAIKLQPDFAQAHYSLGLTLTANPKNKLDWPGAIAEFRAALKGKADYPEALNLLGAGLTATGEIDAAIPELQHAIQLKPAFAAAHFNLAIALEKNDKLEDAAKEYKLAVSSKGEYPEATSALGKLLLRMGKAGEAEAELDRALRLNPDLGDAHYALARVLQNLNRRDEAAVEFDEAKDLAQREPDAVESSVLSNAGLQLAAKGNLKEAVASLRKAIALKPDYGIPHYNLGLILADMGDMSGAISELTKAISLMPGVARPWFDLGRVRALQADRQGALEAVSWAARLAPSDAGIRSELDAMRNAGHTPDDDKPSGQPRMGALADTASDHAAFAAQLSEQRDAMGTAGELLRALALQSDAVDARRQLATAYELLGDHGRAILEYYKIIRVVPGDADSRLFLGNILFETGNAKAAVEEFRAVLALRPNSSEAQVGLGRATRALAKTASGEPPVPR